MKITRFLIALCCLCLFPLAAHAVDTAPRVYFSDAKLSFIFPANWTLEPKFPYGPLFSKTTQEGVPALISCAISQPLQDNKLSADISRDVLKELAERDFAARQPGFKAIDEKDRQLADHNAFEITWESTADGQTLQHRSIYFFVENRVYAITLQAGAKSFRWLIPDFEKWLTSFEILSRKDSGAVMQPAHGGLWIHQTGGIKITIPEEWLIAVSDDHTLGATYAKNSLHADVTATVDTSTAATKELTKKERKELLKTYKNRGQDIMKISEEPFHGYPTLTLTYEGAKGDRAVEGQDIWITTPKGRWLINLEADSSFASGMGDRYQQILNGIQFL